jgi:adenylate cyclase
VLVGAGVTIVDYVQNRKTAMRVASEIFDQKISRIGESRVAFFAPPILIVQQLRDDPGLRQPAGARDSVLKVILSSLAMSPQISAVYAGYENGNFFQVLSISDAEKPFIARLGGPADTRFAIQDIRSDDGVRFASWRFLDAGGRAIGTVDGQATTYDPRVRKWYRDSRAQPERLIRTPPYVFAATSQVGMTLARAFEGGAVGVDMTLDRLMTFIHSIRSNENQRYVAFDDQNRLLGHFNPERMFKPSPTGGPVELGTTADLVDPVVKAAMKVFERDGAYKSAILDVDGSEYMATVVQQDARTGDKFYELFAAPLSDFMGPLANAAARSILAALAVFALALPAIIFFAHSISKPLAKLSREARLIQAFELSAPIKMHSRVREVNALIRSMSGMKGAIREVTKFVPKALVRELLQSEGSVEVGGVTRRVSILFTDIRDFTVISDAMQPEHLMRNLSEYFEELASLIIKEGGTVDKYIGDAVFAFWNAPLPVARH